jgi:hypothetical protein
MMFTNNQKNVVSRSIIPHNSPRDTHAFSSRYLRSYAPTTLPANYPVSTFTPEDNPSSANVRSSSVGVRSGGAPYQQGAYGMRSFSQSAKTPTPVVAEPPPPAKKQMKWGEPTWNLFHAIAEKVKPEYYLIYRSEILDIINMICNTLPCPICANHAVQHMKTIQPHKILTKEDLQNMLWEFHNIVNERKSRPFFPKDQLEPRYSKANLRAIIQTFMFHHTDKGGGFRMVADDFYRSKIVKLLRDWFVKHINIFED